MQNRPLIIDKKREDLPPLRVRHEPPTIAEALAAASDLSDDAEERIAIAASLMGVPAEDVRPVATELARVRPQKVLTISTRSSSARQVVVERKVVVERRTPRVTLARVR
ncbi:hypothetical protein GCM10019059_37310 [Camelimonas fluminis]|uniref:Uncharacterized protein n=1 Tax=Camelimonas fluminis TaxID=1576911 RepID=A0ABV7UGS4_9HYPH|nr:hypothetical protein [Camelimonas fluminis]GHE74314.1 hypothetical protein GCM10019059_37310 [Camelimonas fluminis]